MRISEQDVQEFKKIYREETGNELSSQEAWEAATNLLHFVALMNKISRKTKAPLTDSENFP